MADGMQKDWRELCVAVANESDSTKLTSLGQELIDALDKGERRWRLPIRPLTQSRRMETSLESPRHFSDDDFAFAAIPGNSLTRPSGINYPSSLRRLSMADGPRITVEELKRRMDAGEDFTVIDVRNPNAWAETDTVIPEAIRVPLDKLEENLPRIPKGRPVVAYCT